jgi:DNA-directed RNA polymerase specialized sigma24 family protein
MSLGAQLAPHLPYARRYARALCGDQPAGDTLVVTFLKPRWTSRSCARG